MISKKGYSQKFPPKAENHIERIQCHNQAEEAENGNRTYPLHVSRQPFIFVQNFQLQWTAVIGATVMAGVHEPVVVGLMVMVRGGLHCWG
jgi:hypothetical protein